MARRSNGGNPPSGNQDDYYGPPPQRPRPDITQMMTLGGIVVLLMISFGNWPEIQDSLDSRLGRLETQIAQIPNRAPAPAAAPARRGPDPDRVYEIGTDGAPSKGPAGAPVAIAEFSDFQCPFCARVGPTLNKIEEVYSDNVRIVWKHLPLNMHKEAVPAALASIAAWKQGKFWEFHDKIFADQRNLNLETFKKHAQAVGINIARFEKDFLDLSNRKAVDDDAKEAAALGVTGTPGLFVNGRFLNGAKPFEEFAKVIKAELASKGIAVPAEAVSD